MATAAGIYAFACPGLKYSHPRRVFVRHISDWLCTCTNMRIFTCTFIVFCMQPFFSSDTMRRRAPRVGRRGEQKVDSPNQGKKKITLPDPCCSLPSDEYHGDGAPVGELRIPRHRYAYGGTDCAPRVLSLIGYSIQNSDCKCHAQADVIQQLGRETNSAGISYQAYIFGRN